MTKPWTENLTEGQVAFMNNIISQVPETMGAREQFIKCLQNLSDTSEAPQLIGPKENMFRFYVVNVDGEVSGTNDEMLAQAYADVEENYVIDVDNNQWILAEGDGTYEICAADDFRVAEEDNEVDE
jgi:hypothetical protein